MTIHRDFFQFVKEGCGQAFTDAPPRRPAVVFIDGQVKLMKADAITSWEMFFTVQFYKTIEKCFTLGAHTVVLAFDDYEHVPASKAMTQAKRAKQRVNYEFAQASALPSCPPEDWGSAMANRTFKVKVVCRVLEVARVWFEKKLQADPSFAGRTLVLDYRGVPEVLHAPDSSRGNSVREFVAGTDWAPVAGCIGRGECDIKAFAWLPLARSGGALCIVSVDGDFLPLSLMQSSSAGCDILLYRMVTRAPTGPAKRKSPASEPAQRAPRREYEYVHIAPVAAWLHDVFPCKVADPVQQFCAMVALCGCDFARNLPRLGPRSLWKLRHRLQNSDLSQPEQALSGIACLYHDMFVAHNVVPPSVRNSAAWFQSVTEEGACAVYEDLARKVRGDHKISETIRKQLWPVETTRVHTRNASWTLQYWSLLANAPDPLAADFGYVRDSKGRTAFAA